MNQVTGNCMSMFLDLFREILPTGAYVPQSWYEAKKGIRDLGLGHEKIDACENDCVLFWKEHEDKDKCPQCQTSRYKMSIHNENESSASKRVPKKVLRYFPLKDRLQRMFMSSKIAKWMTWHSDGRTFQQNGEMRHPADSEAWVHFDNLYPNFAAEVRNVRLGLASDGFNPFANLSSRYSIWPVLMVVYNLPPWMCMKQTYTMMSLLIPGPKDPGNDIDVYLQPLMDELKDLWYNGVQTYDAAKKQNFNMRASLLWTLNDFPAYANLSGWSTRGTYACPTCNYSTHSKKLKNCQKFCYLGHRRFLPVHHRWRKNTYKDRFDGQVEFSRAPKILNGQQLWEQQQSVPTIRFGKTFKKDIEKLKGWKKRVFFFRELPYWQNLLIRNNLDVMHIEKNVCNNLLGTLNLLGPGYSKDTVKARMDLEAWGIRPHLHVPKDDNGKPPAAMYTLNRAQRLEICDFLRNIKVPDGYSSNLSKCVDFEHGKLMGLKSHDCHVYMQVLLPLAIRGIVHVDVTDPLTELSMYFKDVCSKVLRPERLLKLEADVAVTLCKLEQIFPPAFFTVMIHLIVHLAYEARIAGPVQYRWMYPIERYLKKLKDYVLNKARPEGSIVEGYLLEETTSFCSIYMEGINTQFNRSERNYEGAPGGSDDVESLSIFNPSGRFLKGKVENRVLSDEEVQLAHSYILKQIEDIDSFRDEHKNKLETSSGVEKDFMKWFQSYVQQLKHANDPRCTHDIEILSQTPSKFAYSHSGYIVNGFRFRTRAVDDIKQTQLCGVVVIADLNNGCDGYYGHLKDVVEIIFDHQRRVILFECDWWDVYHEDRGFQIDKYGIISLNTLKKLGTNEPFALAQQVEQVFYVDDNRRTGWIIPIRAQPRDYYNMHDEVHEDENAEAYQENLIDVPVTGEILDVDVTEGINIRVGEYIET
jgi:hypothetical protein